MNQTRAKAILAALTPEVRAERQRIVDRAVRAARESGHCDTFNSMLGLVFPEFMIEVDGYKVALDSNAGTCRSREGQTVWEYYGLTNNAPERFGADGYSVRTGLDRDGFDRAGFDTNGFDANDMGRSRSRVARRTRWIDEAGQPQESAERWYQTGIGEYSNRDATGNLRMGRGPTDDELAAEAAALAEWEAVHGSRFNPTTWQPEPEFTGKPGVSTEVPTLEETQATMYDSDNDEDQDYEDDDE